MATRWTEADAGLLIDGVHGWYAIGAMIDLAVNNGYELGNSDTKAMVAFHTGAQKFESDLGGHLDASDWILNQGGLADQALEWMNEHLAPEAHIFHWYDGNFYLSPLSEFEQDI